MLVNEGGFIESADRMPKPTTEVDPRLLEVASLHLTLKESEGGYTFFGYASDPRQNDDYWIIHVMEDGKLIHDTKIPRLDGGDFTHNDLTRLGSAVDQLKRIFNPSIDVKPSY